MAVDRQGRHGTCAREMRCRVISLDDRQMARRSRKYPEFALMLLSVMIGPASRISRSAGDSDRPGHDRWMQPARCARTYR